MLDLVFGFTVGLLLFVYFIVNNHRINRTITANKNRVLDSESDDEGGLFGKPQQQQQQQPPLFGGPQVLPKSRGSSNSNLFGNADSNPVAGGKNVGSVENVRAMPNPTQSLPPASKKNHKPSADLFASDSNDEENLFSSKAPVAGKVRGQSNKIQEESVRNTRTSGLFSSDDDAPLFSTAPVNSADNNQEDESERSEEPQSKSSGKKAPVGGVKLFGSAITSALRRQKSSDSEPSDDNEDDWGSNKGDSSSRASSTSLHKPEPPPLSSNQSKVTKRSDNIKSGGGLGLFDDDEDDEDLFSAAVKTPSASRTAKNNKSESNPPPVMAYEKAKPPSKTTGETVITKTERSSVGKMFSDDDDDYLFGATKKTVLSQPLPKEKSAIEVKGKSGPSTSRPADLPLPTENIKKPSQPVKIPEPPKALSSSLFSSPSDDDDLFSAPKVSQVSAKASSAFVTDPPPIIQDSGKVPPTSGSQAGSTKEQTSKNTEVKTGKAGDKLQPPPATSNRLFSSPSDEDELFSTDSKKQDDLFTAPTPKTSIGSMQAPSKADVRVKTSKAGDKLKPPTTPRLFSSPSDEDELFSGASKAPDPVPVSTDVEVKPSKAEDKLRPPSTPRLFSSPSDEDELFANVPKVPNAPSTNAEVKPEDKLKPPPSGRLFSSPSDEDELFSGVPKSVEVQKSQEKVPSKDSSSAAVTQGNADTVVNVTQSSDLQQKSQSSIFDSPEDDIFKSKSLTSGAKSSLFASNLDDDIDDIFSGSVSKSQSGSRTLIDTKKTISNIFEGIDDDDDDIFASTQKVTKPSKSPTQNKPSTKNVSNIVSHVKSETEKPLDERKTSTDTEKQSSMPTSMDTSKEVTPPTQPKVKKPVGGIALFGGAELADQLSKRKSILGNNVTQKKDADEEKSTPSQSTEVFKPEEKNKPSTGELLKSKEEKSSSKSGIFGSESDDDNLFGGSSPPKVPHLNNPPRLPPTKDSPPTVVSSSKPKDIPSKPEAVPPKPQKKPKAEELKKGEDGKSQAGGLLNDVGVVKKSRDRSESESKEKEKESGETSEARKEPTIPSKMETKSIENKVKDQETIETSREIEENKPKKKPPIGGVSMFGGGGIGGKELLAKVQKRKSMMAPESANESDEESTTTTSSAAQPLTSGTSLTSEERSKAEGTPPPTLASPLSSSPRSPLSPVPVFLPSASNNVLRKSGGEESSVSFEDPASNASTLESLNKTRARGSVKRRPPSRAHRKSAINNQDPSETPTTTTSPDADTTTNSTEPQNISQPVTTKEAARIGTLAQPTTTKTNSSEPQHKSALLPTEKERHTTAIDRVDSPLVNATDSAVEVNKDPVASKGNVNPGVTGESKDAVKDEDSSLVTISNSALNQSKQVPVTKISSSTKASSSLFGGSDSEEEDLFGKKPKSQPVKTSPLPVSNSVTKQTERVVKPVSLFGDDDDDDDIFSSGAKARSKPVTTRQSSTSKPKTNLKTSSEPFEDPLLGNLK
ncbi:hypothetical protein Pmani_021035 [Petrolisthes manimaculis]|uniref:FAM21/CAPZIP domain-containing protein n=1 Tax=Petrolisthes manimaculis TaxID=1843537 RepID=A0AAE1PH32_9EUCA|nr:hypothetical protein Pmani_021035 [Petrolisthes manimaculis]